MREESDDLCKESLSQRLDDEQEPDALDVEFPENSANDNSLTRTSRSPADLAKNLSEIKMRFPQLTKPEENTLALAAINPLRDARERKLARDTLICHMTYLVIWLARKMELRFKAEFDDLVSIGFIAVHHAIDRFSADRGDFSYLAASRVKRAIETHIRKSRVIAIPENSQKFANKARRSLDQEQAGVIDSDLEAAQELIAAQSQLSVLSLESLSEEGEESPYLKDSEERQPEALMERKARIKLVYQAIQALGKTERNILMLKFGFRNLSMKEFCRLDILSARAVRSLNPQTLQCLMQQCLGEELSNDQICMALKIPKSKFRTLLQRSQRHLRQALEQERDNLRDQTTESDAERSQNLLAQLVRRAEGDFPKMRRQRLMSIMLCVLNSRGGNCSKVLLLKEAAWEIRQAHLSPLSTDLFHNHSAESATYALFHLLHFQLIEYLSEDNRVIITEKGSSWLTDIQRSGFFP